MKNIYLTMVCLVSVFYYSIGTAQNLTTTQNLEFASETSFIEYSKPNKNKTHNKAAGDTIWYEGFGNGIPNDWTIDDVSGICPWQLDFDGSNGNFAGTPTPINSVTSANGFIIADNDSCNHANFGQPSGTTYQYLNTNITTGAINCSNNAGIILTFQQFFRYNNSPDLNVSVSNDSINWTIFNVKGVTPANTASVNGELVEINISSVADSQATVYIRFGWDARVYYWMIDDILLIEAEDYDLRINQGLASNNYYSGVNELAYTQVPESQISPITFSSEVQNIGSQTQQNVVLITSIPEATFLDTLMPPLPVLNSGKIDTITGLTPTFTPSGLGVNTITSYVKSLNNVDANPINDTFLNPYSLEITSNIYARDEGVINGSINNLSRQTGDPFSIGNFYEIIDPITFYAIDVYLSTNTDITSDEIITGEIYLFNTTNSTYTFLQETNEMVINDANQVGQFISLILEAPVSTTAGDLLLVVCKHNGGDVFIGMSGNALAGEVRGFDAAAMPYSLASPRIPMVRLNSDPAASINTNLTENKAALFQNFPNPAKGETSIQFSLTNANNIHIKLYDMAGKEVAVLAHGKFSAGKHQVNFNTQALQAGVYTYSLITEEGIQSKNLIVIK